MEGEDDAARDPACEPVASRAVERCGQTTRTWTVIAWLKVRVSELKANTARL